jgi:hypothetical protein
MMKSDLASPKSDGKEMAGGYAANDFDERLGKALVDGLFLTQAQLETAQDRARSTGEKLVRLLVADQFVTPQALASALTLMFNAPVLDIRDYMIQPETLALVPEKIAREWGVLPLNLEGDCLWLAMEEPQSSIQRDALEAITHKHIKPVVPMPGSLRETIEANYKSTRNTRQQFDEMFSNHWSPVNPMVETLTSPPYLGPDTSGVESRKQTGGSTSQAQQMWLWAAALLLFAFGDTLTSLMVFYNNGAEANYFLRLVLTTVGPTVWGFLLVKTGTTIVAVLVARLQPRLELIASVAILLIGMFLVAQNASTLLTTK